MADDFPMNEGIGGPASDLGAGAGLASSLIPRICMEAWGVR